MGLNGDVGDVGDIGEEAFAKEVITQTITTFGKLDVLINNAGVSMFSRFDQIQDISFIRNIMKINYMKPVKGKELIAAAKIIHRGSQTAIGDVEDRGIVDGRRAGEARGSL